MYFRAFFAVVCGLVLGVDANGQEWATNMFSELSHDFGVVARGGQVEYSFELTNLYEEDVHIASVRSSCGCAVPTVTRDTLKSWEKGQVVCQFNGRSLPGDKNTTITIVFDSPYPAEVQLGIRGFIRSDVVVDPGVVQFGSIPEGVEALSSVEISYAGRSDWRIVDVRSANRHFEVELKEAVRDRRKVKYVMHVWLNESHPAGYINDQLTLVTDDGESSAIPISVEGRVVPSLTVSPASLFLGVVPAGQQVSKRLVVRGPRPFRIVDVTCDDGCFQFSCPEGARTLHFLPVVFTASSEPGKVVKSIEIQTDIGDGAAASCVATATVVEERRAGSGKRGARRE